MSFPIMTSIHFISIRPELKVFNNFNCQKGFTFDLLTADVQQWFGVEAHCGHSGDHVLGVGKAELVCH